MGRLISPEYLELNRALHAKGKYGISGARWSAEVNALATNMGCKSVLDYGCGQGTLLNALPVDRPYTVEEYDPAIEGKETKPANADLVVCGDVLEHIEPECLYAVLDDIRSIANKAVFLVIATRPAVKTLADGRNAHLIVEPAGWWEPKLCNRWFRLHAQNLGPEFVFIGGILSPV